MGMKKLCELIERLNRFCGTPNTGVGSYQLARYDGRIMLQRQINENGGVRTLVECEKPMQAFYMIHGFMAGAQDATTRANAEQLTEGA